MRDYIGELLQIQGVQNVYGRFEIKVTKFQ